MPGTEKHDWIASVMNNPTYDSGDFRHIYGMNIDNTLLLPMTEYFKYVDVNSNPAFLDENGDFDTSKFAEFYDYAVALYLNFADDSSVSNYRYDPLDTLRPPTEKVKDINFQMYAEENPEHITYGFANFNTIGLPEESRRELAQKSHIVDSVTGEDYGYSVNDISLFSSPIRYIQSLFDDPLVYATYDEDTDEFDPYSGQMVHRKKGEWKVRNGEYYTETLNKRSLLDKDVVSAFDYITSDTSKINKYDFFDADGLEKSLAGTITRSVVSAVPMFITPIGNVYASIIIARELAKSMPMLYGTITGLLGAENIELPELNWLASYGEKFTLSTSDYDKENMITLNNIADMMGEVANQWGTQRYIARSIAKMRANGSKAYETAVAKARNTYVKEATNDINKARAGELSMALVANRSGAANVKGIQELAESGAWQGTEYGTAALRMYMPEAEAEMRAMQRVGGDVSLMYMAVISNTDVYQDALQRGATPREAAMITLGSSIGMYSVDRYLHLGEMFFDQDEVLLAVRGGAKAAFDEIVPAGFKTAKEMTTLKGVLGALQKGIRVGRNAIVKYYDRMATHQLGIPGKAFGEGLEEVAEEIVSDLSRYIAECAGTLGYASMTDYGAFDNWFERYLMNFLGGASGGAMFGTMDVITSRKDKSNKLLQDVVYLLRNGHKDELMQEFHRMYREGTLGSKRLAAETTKNEAGDDVYLPVDDEKKSQAYYALQALIAATNLIDMILNEYGLNLSEGDLFSKLVLSEDRTMLLSDFLKGDEALAKTVSYFSHWQQDMSRLTLSILTAEQKIADHKASITDAAHRDKDYNEKLDRLVAERDALLDERDAMFGKKSLGYVDKMLFAMDPSLSGQFTPMNYNQYVRRYTGKTAAMLSELEAKTAKDKYLAYLDGRQRNIDDAYRAYRNMRDDLKQELIELNTTLANVIRSNLLNEVSLASKTMRWNERMPGEKERDYVDRNRKRAGESDEDFKNRQEARRHAMERYNDDHIGQWIEELLSHELSVTEIRRIAAEVGVLRKTVFSDLVEGYITPTNNPHLENTHLRDAIWKILKASNMDHMSRATRRKIELAIRSLVEDDMATEFLEPDTYEYFYGKALTSSSTATMKDIYDAIERARQRTRNPKAKGTLTDPEVRRLMRRIGWDPLSSTTSGLKFDTTTREGILNNRIKDYYLSRARLESQMEAVNARAAQVETAYNAETDQSRKETILQDLQRLREELATLSDLLNQLETNNSGIIAFGDAAYDHMVNERVGTVLNGTGDPIYKTVVKDGQTVTELVGVDRGLTPLLRALRRAVRRNGYIRGLGDVERRSITSNPVMPLLKKIIANYQGLKANIELVLQDIYALYNAENAAQDFLLTEDQINSLLSFATLIDMVKAVVYGATVQEGYATPIGHSHMLNNFIENHRDVFSGIELLPTLDMHQGTYMLHELNSYKKEMLAWIDLSNRNTGGRTRRLVVAGEKLDLSFLKYWDTYRDNFRITVTVDVDKEKRNQDIDLLDGYEEINDLDIPNFVKITKIEQLVHDNFRKAVDGGISANQILDALFLNPDLAHTVATLKSALHQETAKLDDTMEYAKLTDYDKIVYVVTTLAVDNYKFYKRIKNAIESDEKKLLAPLRTLIYDARVLYAQKADADLVDYALLLMHDSHSDDAINLDMPILWHTGVVTGVGGAGKSSFVIRVLIDPEETTWVCTPTKQLLSNLLSSLGGASTNATYYTTEELIKALLTTDDAVDQFMNPAESDGNGNWTLKNGVDLFTITDGLQGMKTVKLAVDDDGNCKLDKLIKPFTTNKPDYIIFDEATHLTTALAALISYVAKKNGISVLYSGDTYQNGAILNGVMENISEQAVVGFRAPKMFISLRESNALIAKTFPLMYDIMDLFNSISDDIELAKRLPEFASKIQAMRLPYYMGEQGFHGFRIMPTLDDATVGAMKGKIGFVGDAATSDAYKRLVAAGLNPIEFTPLSVQGSEFDYVIVDKNWQTKFSTDNALYCRDAYFFTLDLYTMTSRAMNGGVIIDNDGLSGVVLDYEENYTGTIAPIASAVGLIRSDMLGYLDTFLKDAPAESTDGSGLTTATDAGGTSSTTLDESDLEGEEAPVLKPSGDDLLEVINEDDNNEVVIVRTSGSPVRVYTNIHIGGINTAVNEWRFEDDGHARRDLGLFIGDQTITDGKGKDDLVLKLVDLKSAFLYRSKNNELIYYRLLPQDIKALVTLDALANATLTIRTEKPTDYNRIVGLTDLSNDPKDRAIDNGRTKMVTLVAKFKMADGSDGELTIGAFAKPSTWAGKDNVNRDRILSAITKRVANILKLLSDSKTTDLQKVLLNNEVDLLNSYANNLDNSIKQYTQWVEDRRLGDDDTTLNDTRRVDMTHSMSSIVRRKTPLRLLNMYPGKSAKKSVGAFRAALRYYKLDTSVRTPLTNIPGCKVNSKGDTLVRGRATIFGSGNSLLRFESADLLKAYMDLKKDTNNDVVKNVRMILLDMVGIPFDTLYNKTYEEIYEISANDRKSNKYSCPLVMRTLGLRMFYSLWNTRAELKQFNTEYKKFIVENLAEFSEDDIEKALQVERLLYLLYANENTAYGSFEHPDIDEQTFRNHLKALNANRSLNDRTYNIITKIHEFNDSLIDSVRRFRLGYSTLNGAYIRRLTGDIKASTLYSEKEKKGLMYGTYINPKLAGEYEDVLDQIFQDVVERFVDINEGTDITKPLTYSTLIQVARKGSRSLKMDITLEDDNNVKHTVTVSGDLMSTFAVAFILTAKYLRMEADLGRDYMQSRYLEGKFSISPTGRTDELAVAEEGALEDDIKWFNISKRLSDPNDPTIKNIGQLKTTTFGAFNQAAAKPGIRPTVVSRNAKGQIISLKGYMDKRLDNLFMLTFHGTTWLSNESIFDGEERNGRKIRYIRDTAAKFKFGFFADAILPAPDGQNRDFGQVLTNEALMQSDSVIGMPILGVNLWGNINELLPLRPTTTLRATKSKATTLAATTLNTNKFMDTLNKIDADTHGMIALSTDDIANAKTVADVATIANTLLSELWRSILSSTADADLSLDMPAGITFDGSNIKVITLAEKMNNTKSISNVRRNTGNNAIYANDDKGHSWMIVQDIWGDLLVAQQTAETSNSNIGPLDSLMTDVHILLSPGINEDARQHLLGVVSDGINDYIDENNIPNRADLLDRIMRGQVLMADVVNAILAKISADLKNNPNESRAYRKYAFALNKAVEHYREYVCDVPF